jgi:hypothetical protein
MSLKITYTAGCKCGKEHNGATPEQASRKAKRCDHSNPPRLIKPQKLVNGVWQDVVVQ